MTRKTLALFDSALLWPAIAEAFKKLDPRVQLRNPVMFVVYIGSIFTVVLTCLQFNFLTLGISLWLWFTVLFANFAEALAEGRSKAQGSQLAQPEKDNLGKTYTGDFYTRCCLECGAIPAR